MRAQTCRSSWEASTSLCPAEPGSTLPANRKVIPAKACCFRRCPPGPPQTAAVQRQSKVRKKYGHFSKPKHWWCEAGVGLSLLSLQPQLCMRPWLLVKHTALGSVPSTRHRSPHWMKRVNGVCLSSYGDRNICLQSHSRQGDLLLPCWVGWEDKQ